MPELLFAYKNGNYSVKLYDDGTKVKQTVGSVFKADFPDSLDLKITDYCENNCPMCHENSGVHGRHADLLQPITNTFLPGTEVAIGGGDPLSHPGLVPFLQRLKQNKVVANITVNQKDLVRNEDLLMRLIDSKLIFGLGISCLSYDHPAVDFAQKHPNVVLHLINGVFPAEDYNKLFGKDLKILILGYKRFGRGEAFYNEKVAANMAETQRLLPQILKGFKVVSFDNLALSQLIIKELVGKEEYERIYMGDDGEASMYIDLVKQEFGISSTSTERYPLLDTVKDCFQSLQR